MIKIFQSLSLAGGKKNIDLIRATNECVLVLDGSTPLVNSEYDASRFTEDFADAFFDRVERGESVPNAINSALSDVFSLFEEEVAESNVDMYPSACLLVAYVNEGRLNIINIGDTSALVIMKDKSVINITCGDVSCFDEIVIARAKQIRKEIGADICDIMNFPEIRRMLIDNRRKMNKPDGYRILAFGMTDVVESEIISFDARDIERVVLHSDGFDRYADELSAEGADIKKLYTLLRKEENADAKLNVAPRFKVSDDASAVIFTVEQ